MPAIDGFWDRNMNNFPSALGNNCDCGGFLVFTGKTKTGKRMWKCGACDRTEIR